MLAGARREENEMEKEIYNQKRSERSKRKEKKRKKKHTAMLTKKKSCCEYNCSVLCVCFTLDHSCRRRCRRCAFVFFSILSFFILYSAHFFFSLGNLFKWQCLRI